MTDTADQGSEGGKNEGGKKAEGAKKPDSSRNIISSEGGKKSEAAGGKKTTDSTRNLIAVDTPIPTKNQSEFFSTLAPFYLDSILEHEQTLTFFRAHLKEQMCVIFFRAHLKEQMCEENLRFWLDSQKYRILAKEKIRDNPEVILKAGVKLWKTYLDTGAEFEISLPSDTFKEVKADVENGRFGIYTFASAQEQTYQDMLSDSLPKFHKSAIYPKMIQTLIADLAPKIVVSTDKTWRCKMCQEENNRKRMACSNCGFKYEQLSSMTFQTCLHHPLGQAILQTWLRRRSRKKDAVLLDYVLAVTRLKNTPFNKQEQKVQCANLTEYVRPLLRYILKNSPEASKIQITVNLLIDSLPYIVDRLENKVFPRFIKSNVHRRFVLEIERVVHGLGDEDIGMIGMEDSASDNDEPEGDKSPQPTPRNKGGTSSKSDDEEEGDEDLLNDFAALLSRPKALKAEVVASIKEQVQAEEERSKYWSCAVCKQQNLQRRATCSNCELPKSTSLDKGGKLPPAAAAASSSGSVSPRGAPPASPVRANTLDGGFSPRGNPTPATPVRAKSK
eukprot:g32903.t1